MAAPRRFMKSVYRVVPTQIWGISLIALGSLLGPAAHADFKLVPLPDTKQTASATAAQKVKGFGSAVPLLVAATEIVPAPLLVELSAGVDANAPLSWQGGDRPWADVFKDALEPLRLGFHVDGNHVVVDQIGPAVQLAGTPLPAAALKPAPPEPNLPATGAPVPLAPAQAASSRSTPPLPPVVVPVPPAVTPVRGMPAPVVEPNHDAPSAMESAPAPPPAWTAEKGSYLHDVIISWMATVPECHGASGDFVDKTTRDYPTGNRYVTHAADIYHAIQDLVREGFADAKPALKLDLWPKGCSVLLSNTSDNFGSAP